MFSLLSLFRDGRFRRLAQNGQLELAVADAPRRSRGLLVLIGGEPRIFLPRRAGGLEREVGVIAALEGRAGFWMVSQEADFGTDTDGCAAPSPVAAGLAATAAPPTRVVTQQLPVMVRPSADSVDEDDVSIDVNVSPLQVHVPFGGTERASDMNRAIRPDQRGIGLSGGVDADGP